ncbi:cytochrome c peroxidase [Siphonobacter sp. SORGH_AS_0500]|uniref:cytochrome c peroxidase n=1 Tax=Siphonobacter sp. SORGH_AS_0500 TaxID=1864824 RepID=UPI0028635E4B|nr:cytochrome c peroxidase [Siphonobacter sp. SORGH_AS_0500]MDR6197408.1 cytochrome c peroxidase [Siphonobacter sp. SORGH_AS_0500]
MKKSLIFCLSLGILAGVIWWGCQPKQSRAALVQEQFRKDIIQLDSSVSLLLKSVESKAKPAEIQSRFCQARLAYKRVEWLTDYYFPETAKNLNGPPLDEFEEADQVVIPPEGFQVIEEYLFPQVDTTQNAALLQHLRVLKANLTRLTFMDGSNQLTDQHIFDAARLELFRIFTLGISGFDSPAALHSLPEARAALRAIEDNINVYREELQEEDPVLAQQLQRQFELCHHPLQGSFEAFNRLDYLTEHLNPLSKKLYEAQLALRIEPFGESRALSASAMTMHDSAAFNPEHYLSVASQGTTPQKVELGKRLFYDPILSGNHQRSCASCHQPDKAFTDGITRSASLSGGTIQRNTPSLLNAALQARLFSDSRVVYLEDQAQDVIANIDEMHGSLEKAVDELQHHAAYKKAFQKAYPTEAISPQTIRNAIAAYERTLLSLNSRFDQYVRGNYKALNASEKRGFNLFAGKAKCATCHFLPLMNGTVPPFYEKAESEVLGVPAQAGWKNLRLDSDLGKYNLTKADLHRHAFKTPTVRNVELTAPYMHNGVYKTLEEVVEFYDRGGGQGLGLIVPNQTLAADSLHLTIQEKADLVNFMKALTDVSAIQ